MFFFTYRLYFNHVRHLHLNDLSADIHTHIGCGYKRN